MQSRNSDPSDIEKSIARKVKNANENAASSSRHQNENTRPSIEKSIAEIQNRFTETRSTNHIFEILNTPYLEKVFANVRQKLSRQEEDKMLDLGVNGIILGIFVSATKCEHTAHNFTLATTLVFSPCSVA